MLDMSLIRASLSEHAFCGIWYLHFFDSYAVGESHFWGMSTLIFSFPRDDCKVW